MLTFDDCVAFSPLSPEEVEAISRCAHMPDLCALELGAHLLHFRDGRSQIEAMLTEEIANAQRRGDPATAGRLRRALAHFQDELTYPGEARAGAGRG